MRPFRGALGHRRGGRGRRACLRFGFERWEDGWDRFSERRCDGVDQLAKIPGIKPDAVHGAGLHLDLGGEDPAHSLAADGACWRGNPDPRRGDIGSEHGE